MTLDLVSLTKRRGPDPLQRGEQHQNPKLMTRAEQKIELSVPEEVDVKDIRTLRLWMSVVVVQAKRWMTRSAQALEKAVSCRLS